jgi:hypothetical protein
MVALHVSPLRFCQSFEPQGEVGVGLVLIEHLPELLAKTIRPDALEAHLVLTEVLPILSPKPD